MKTPLLYTFAGIGVLAAAFVGYTQFAGADARQNHTSEMTAPQNGAQADDYVLIKYDGGEVLRSDLDKAWDAMFAGRPDSPKFDELDANMRMDVLRNLAREYVLLEEAKEAGADKSPEVEAQLQSIKRQLVIQAYLKNKVKDLVPEEKVKAQYDAMKKQYADKEEVKARHILVKTQEEAKAIEKELKSGADFEKIAKEKSTDKGSGAKGGDLGYFTREQMVPEFSTAAFKLKKGEVSAPVKSDFGWHIIQVEDRRPLEAPTYETVREKLEQGLAGAAVQEYVTKITDAANVKYYDKEGKEFADVKGEASPAAGGMTPIPANPAAQ